MRKMHENSLANLSKAKNFTTETARKAQRKSVDARKERKTLKNSLLELLDADYETETGEVMTGAMLVCIALFNKALEGDCRAFEIIRDTVGEKPVTVVESSISPEQVAEVEALFQDAIVKRRAKRIESK